FTLALLSGACAGTTVDIALYPLDTLKVRLQSEKGFMAAGGFRGVYTGVLATALGAAPGAAFFFSAYEGFKPIFRSLNGGVEHPLQHSCSASVGEVAACLVRVPTGVVTQRMQARYSNFLEAVRGIAAQPGGLSTFYLGFWTTVAREIPFSFIQFPMYEGLKKAPLLAGAVCGSLSGSVAAALTCPLDVVKTRMMLGSKPAAGTLSSLRTIAAEEGAAALLKGIGPRVGWISIGGSLI
ncbi:mitochondrial carrier, partial [Emiliania huxleyi CCMP1516]|uniref:Mitochondrial carrier protein n=2 Tax=Emiliania huxleyi TaxID=2903 RepID=A0A0D3IXB9_EMIH1